VPQLTQVAPAVPHVVADWVWQVVPEQQPPGQLVALHPLHAPPVQLSPEGHIAHVPPPAPQAVMLFPGWQVLPWQQPVEHEAAVQMHEPPEQTCPAAHAAAPPQVHAPVDEQPSAVAPHAMHAAPFVPHVPADGVVQVGPEQHPVGHEAAVHVQMPFEHTWPAPHAAAPPHEQAPVPEQPSALVPQSTHAAPAVPQAVVEGVVHVEPTQHPVGQFDALQVVATSPGASVMELSAGASTLP
jgi:hypothetical protein